MLQTETPQEAALYNSIYTRLMKKRRTNTPVRLNKDETRALARRYEAINGAGTGLSFKVKLAEGCNILGHLVLGAADA